MKTFLLFLCGLLGLSLCGCSAIKTRVIEVPRVDHKDYGNRGYVSGSVPEYSSSSPAPASRQIIEIDLTKWLDKSGK